MVVSSIISLRIFVRKTSTSRRQTTNTPPVNALDLLMAVAGAGLGRGVNGAVDLAGDLDVVVGELAELAVVEAELLLLGGHAQGQAGDEVHDEEQEAGQDEGPGEGGAGAGNLVTELDPVVLDPADGVVGTTVKVGNDGAGKGLAVVKRRYVVVVRLTFQRYRSGCFQPCHQCRGRQRYRDHHRHR